MLIAIDGRPFQGNITGVGRYVYEICALLDRSLQNTSFHIYSNRPISIEPFSSRWEFRYENNVCLKKLHPPLWLKFFSAKLINRDEPTCFWGPASFLPFGLKKGIKSLLTVHDLNYLIAPETMTIMYQLFFRLFFKSELRRAHLISTNSQGTSNRLEHFFSKKADIVVPPSVNRKKFYPPSTNISQIIKKKYNLEDHYFLSVSTLEPRKNLDVLINGFELFLKENPEKNCKLVLVGGSGWKNKGLLNRISNNSSIQRLGFVPDEELPALYANAISLIFPSKYEGFGIPVLEARLCGTTTIASDISEIREAGGDDTVYIKPDAQNIAAAMEKVWNEPPKVISTDFITWEESGERISRALIEISQK